jgi:hypothetical protein
MERMTGLSFQAGKPGRPPRLERRESRLEKLEAVNGFSNMSLPSRAVVRFYNKRGTAAQWIKEGKQATNWTRLSCHRFRSNEVRLQLAVLAYNLGNLWRPLGLPRRVKRWSLTSLQHRLMKTGGRLVKHTRYYWLFLAEGRLNRRLFGEMLARLAALPVPGGVCDEPERNPSGWLSGDRGGAVSADRALASLSCPAETSSPGTPSAERGSQVGASRKSFFHSRGLATLSPPTQPKRKPRRKRW